MPRQISPRRIHIPTHREGLNLLRAHILIIKQAAFMNRKIFPHAGTATPAPVPFRNAFRSRAAA
jgi:hypothetical protein